MSADDQRDSKAADPVLIRDPDEQARVEALNGLKQFDHVLNLVREWTDPERKFRLRHSMLLALHRTALAGLSGYAGNYRPGNVEIGKSRHTPPGAHLVPDLVEDMCDYVNANFDGRPAIHLAAYVMWRLNWIHPFADGNGRTARAASYLVLCVKSGNVLPGSNTIPEQITKTLRTAYYEALEAADDAWKDGRLDLSKLEDLLSSALATQLADYYRAATGRV